MASLYQQKWENVRNVKMEYYVQHVIIKSLINKEFEANLNLLKRKAPMDLVICFLILNYKVILSVINNLNNRSFEIYNIGKNFFTINE